MVTMLHNHNLPVHPKTIPLVLQHFRNFLDCVLDSIFFIRHRNDNSITPFAYSLSAKEIHTNTLDIGILWV